MSNGIKHLGMLLASLTMTVYALSVLAMDANFPNENPIDAADAAVNTATDQHLGQRPEILQAVHLESDKHQPILAVKPVSATWVTFALQRWRWLCLGGAAFVALLITAALVNTKADNLQGSKTPTEPNQEALLALATTNFEALNSQVNLQLDATYERLIDLEATRFLHEAEQQTLDASKPCYRRGVPCVLDQFESDAIAGYADGTKTLQRQTQLEALLRLAIVDRARTGLRLAAEPDNALTLTALQKRLEARQLARQATAEGMAQDLSGFREPVLQQPASQPATAED